VQPSPEPLTIDPAAAVDAAAKAVGEAVAFVGNLGHDISPAEKKKAAATIIPAVIITQVAQAAVAAAGAASIGGSRKGKK
jgi:anti-sigma factor ChrR (cupin superfamily)